MSDLKARIIKKLQSGGALSLRGHFTPTDIKIYHDPKRAYAQQSRGPSAGYSEKKPAATTQGKGDDPLYRSFEIIKENIISSRDQMLTDVMLDDSIDPEEKKVKQAQIIGVANQEYTRVNQEGLQFKEALDYFNTPGSRGKEISKDFVILSDSGRNNPRFLTQYTDENNRRAFAFVDMKNAYASEGSLLPMTIHQSLSAAKSDPNFIYFLKKNGITDYAALLVGTVTHANLEENVNTFFEGNTIVDESGNSTFRIGETVFSSSELTTIGEGGYNLLSQKYMASLSDQNLARFQVEAYKNYQKFPEYMNTFLLNRANIKAPKAPGDEADSEYSQAVTFFEGRGEKPVEVTLAPKAVLEEDLKKREGDYKSNNAGKGIRQYRRIMNGNTLIDPNLEKQDSKGETAIGKSALLAVIAHDDTADLIFQTNLEPVEDVLDVLGAPNSKDLLSKAVIITNSAFPISMTWGVGFADQNGKSDGDLERLMNAVGNIVRGAIYVQGVEPTDGLYVKWMENIKPLESIVEWMDANKEIISKNEEIWLEKNPEGTEAELKRETESFVAAQYNKRIEGDKESRALAAQKGFDDDIQNGDALLNYFIKRGIPKKEAKGMVDKYKPWLEKDFVVIPQLSFRGRVAFPNKDISNKLHDLHWSVGGNPDKKSFWLNGFDFGIGWDGSLSEDAIKQLNLAHGMSNVKGVWEGDLLLDLSAKRDAVAAVAKFYKEDFDPGTIAGKAAVDKLIDFYTKTYKVNDVQIHYNMPWVIK